MILTVCAVLSAILGVAGGFYVPQKTNQARKVGFLLWIVSDVLLIVALVPVAGTSPGLWATVAQFVYFTASSAVGWWNNRK